ncbi:Rad4-domain-containing protein [Cenococcum geophilum 1.58]|uniref:Rad4-domain-containing protein n=1 Tax=Cenococcum geophilum 1.58 TaxID=794803 RepID=A0ACC8EK81_9PEZI|nr:Rad4-domain-containing protein [Cenococcum geophilum 1.58]OCK91509.1 Rad4-domain-containing protein [Cenococcum geophilum 1.58]
MAGSRGRSRKTVLASQSTSSAARTRGTKGRISKQDTEVPEVFRDLLSEATTSVVAGADEDSKPLKKRRTARGIIGNETDDTRQSPAPNIRIAPKSTSPAPTESDQEIVDYNWNARLHTVTDYSEESDESEFEWEDVGLGQIEGEDGETTRVESHIGDLSIVIGDNKAGKTVTKQVRRKGVTAADKRRRLDIHKVHLLCLLYHVHLRNAWCNDDGAQNILRKLPSPKMLSDLIPNPEHTQAQAAKCFINGLQAIKTMWSSRFSITALGLHKPRWADSEEVEQELKILDNLDPPMQRLEFRKAARILEGSQDVGTQLFCALLRAIGVEARLVCSLQCLPFASIAQNTHLQTPKIQKNTVILDPSLSDASPMSSKSDANASTAPTIQAEKSVAPSRPKRISRLGQLGSARNHGYGLSKPAPQPKPKKIHHTAYPVYWVEAFNSAVQKWVTVDPLSTSTVDKPDKLEPPLGYQQTVLSYVVAFEEDSVAKDITRQYAKAYNAKTRRSRVESTEGGAKWWKKALKVFRRGTILDRDQVEDAALARKEAAEGMPRNVQDFKDHPIYVLERHLKHNQVIHPKKGVGKVNIGTAASSNMESVYRRRDVHIVRSADKWYRLGREVMDGAQPLKHAKRRKRTRHSLTPQAIDPEDDVCVGLYAAFQTELYVPPPVVRGRVPRNAYGNLDIYVPSMIPKDGVHVRSPDAAKAARIVGVDYADAVTGFQFKGRHGAAVIQGIIVASQYREAVEAVIHGFAYMKEEAENAQRSAGALRLWRRFLIGLRIAQRVRGYEIDGQTADVQQEIDSIEDELTERYQAGGFFPDAGPTEPMRPITRTVNSGLAYGGDYGGGFIPVKADAFEGSMDERDLEAHEYAQENGGQHVDPVTKHDMGEGFLPEDSTGEDGGFTREESAPEKVRGEQAMPQEASVLDLSMAGGFLVEVGDFADSSRKVDTTEPTALGYNGHSGRTLRSQSPAREKPGHISTTRSLSADAIEEKTYSSARESTASPDLEAQTSEPNVSKSPPRLPDLVKVDTSDDDRDSLPSNDPEDEDADPDWLVCLTD